MDLCDKTRFKHQLPQAEVEKPSGVPLTCLMTVEMSLSSVYNGYALTPPMYLNCSSYDC